jgi:hypothetical protein
MSITSNSKCLGILYLFIRSTSSYVKWIHTVSKNTLAAESVPILLVRNEKKQSHDRRNSTRKFREVMSTTQNVKWRLRGGCGARNPCVAFMNKVPELVSPFPPAGPC